MVTFTLVTLKLFLVIHSLTYMNTIFYERVTTYYNESLCGKVGQGHSSYYALLCLHSRIVTRKARVRPTASTYAYDHIIHFV